MRTAGRSADTSTSRTVDANVLVLWDDRPFRTGLQRGRRPCGHHPGIRDIVMRQYGSDQPGVVTGEYRFGDTRHSMSDISALRELGWNPGAAGPVRCRVRRVDRRHGRPGRGAGRG